MKAWRRSMLENLEVVCLALEQIREALDRPERAPLVTVLVTGERVGLDTVGDGGPRITTLAQSLHLAGMSHTLSLETITILANVQVIVLADLELVEIQHVTLGGEHLHNGGAAPIAYAAEWTPGHLLRVTVRARTSSVDQIKAHLLRMKASQ